VCGECFRFLSAVFGRKSKHTYSIECNLKSPNESKEIHIFLSLLILQWKRLLTLLE